jgi:hypothetical protein
MEVVSKCRAAIRLIFINAGPDNTLCGKPFVTQGMQPTHQRLMKWRNLSGRDIAEIVLVRSVPVIRHANTENGSRIEEIHIVKRGPKVVDLSQKVLQ